MVAACGDRPLTTETTELASDQAATAMESVHIEIPDGYELVGMMSVRPALTGAPSYTGAYESPTPLPGQVRLDGTVPPFEPATCDSISAGARSNWENYGLDCAMSDMRFALTSRTEAPTLKAELLTGTTASGLCRIYVYWAGT